MIYLVTYRLNEGLTRRDTIRRRRDAAADAFYTAVHGMAAADSMLDRPCGVKACKDAENLARLISKGIVASCGVQLIPSDPTRGVVQFERFKNVRTLGDVLHVAATIRARRDEFPPDSEAWGFFERRAARLDTLAAILKTKESGNAESLSSLDV